MLFQAKARMLNAPGRFFRKLDTQLIRYRLEPPVFRDEGSLSLVGKVTPEWSGCFLIVLVSCRDEIG